MFKLILFLTGRYNFLFPLFARSIYCTLFLLDCFDFAYGYIFHYFNYYLPDFVNQAAILPFVWGSSLVSNLGYVF